MQHKGNEVTFDDIYMAYEDCRRRKKNTKGAMEYEPNALFDLIDLCDEINNRTYKLCPSECFVVKYPIPREVFCASFRDRIVQHLVYRELNPYIERVIINDTASCRIGKGTDYAIRRVATFVRRETENYTDIENTSFLKMDISGFFMSINRQLLLQKVLWVVDNKYRGAYKEVLHYLLPIIILSDVTEGAIRLSPISDWDLIPPNKTLFGNTRGLPIGNITSQLFANFYLNDIDHFVKSRHKSYVRYVDDMIVVDKDKEKLRETKRLVNEKLGEYGMKLNNKKSIVSDVKYGIRFLGVKIYPYYIILDKKRINRLWYTTGLLKNIDDAYLSCACRRGMFVRYHGKRISLRWYHGLPEEWRENLKMDSNGRFHLLGRNNKPDNSKLVSIRLYDGGGDEECITSTKMAC